jgi:hypothetical protein
MRLTYCDSPFDNVEVALAVVLPAVAVLVVVVELVVMPGEGVEPAVGTLPALVELDVVPPVEAGAVWECPGNGNSVAIAIAMMLLPMYRCFMPASPLGYVLPSLRSVCRMISVAVALS